MNSRTLCRGLAVVMIAVGMAAPAGAQSSKPQKKPGIEIEPLVFETSLPRTPVAWVDDVPIPASRLLETILNQNFTTAVNAIMSSKIAEMELSQSKIEISDKEIEEELKRKIAQVAPGQKIEDLDDSISIDHLRSQARTELIWKKLFWEQQNIPEDQRHQQTHRLLMQFFIKQKMGNYERHVRGQHPGPPPGAVAQIIHTPTGNEILVGASEALDLLMGLVKQGAMIDAVESLVSSHIVNLAMSDAQVSVSDAEVADWALRESAKYQAPFSWEVILRMKGTTVDREKERYRRIQAWKKVTHYKQTQDELDAFLRENKDFFKNATKSVSHILVRTMDPVSGLPLGGDAAKLAEAKARTLYQKSMEGADFAYLAEHYSDDSVTARGKGRLAQKVKKWGGGLDEKFQSAAWSLKKVGDISKPVKSRFGWHIIRLDEINAGAATEPDWTQERFQVWIQDEYETRQMKKWEAGLRKAVEIKLAPPAVIFGLKKRSYRMSEDG